MKSVNLLPKERQKELRDDQIFHILTVVIWISVFSFVLVFLAQLGARVYMQAQAVAIRADVERIKASVKKEENEKQKSQIIAINNRIADYKNLAGASPRWSRVLQAFSVLPPPGVYISSFAVDSNKKVITIYGTSESREAVIELYNRILKDDKEFYNIDYPLENVARPDKISFHFSFNVRDDLLAGN
jgi:Tfp pilus assembly protein PilN